MRFKKTRQLHFLFLFVLISFSSCKKDNEKDGNNKNNNTNLPNQVADPLLISEKWDGSLYKEYFYDNEYRLTKVNNYNPNNETFVNYVTYDYNEKSKVVKANTFSFSKEKNKFILNRYLENEYGGGDRMVRTRQFSVDSVGNTGEMTVFEYEYNHAGLVSKFTTLMREIENRNIFSPKSATVYEYDKSDNCITTMLYNADKPGGEMVHVGTNVYSYDNNRNPFYILFGKLEIPLMHYSPNNVIKINTTRYSQANPNISSGYTISYHQSSGFPLESTRTYYNKATEKRSFIYQPR